MSNSKTIRVWKVEKCDTGFECQCCGRVIKNVHLMVNGLKLGSECAMWLDAVYRFNRTPNRKVSGMLRSLGMVA